MCMQLTHYNMPNVHHPVGCSNTRHAMRQPAPHQPPDLQYDDMHIVPQLAIASAINRAGRGTAGNGPMAADPVEGSPVEHIEDQGSH